MANGNIPEPTPGVPWYQDPKFIILFLGMGLSFASQQITGCQTYYKSSDANNHAAAAAGTSGANAAKLDAVKDAAEKVESKVDATKVVADDAKRAAQKAADK
jgi:hypothetical protein